MTPPTPPAGFNLVPAGEFVAGPHQGEKVEAFYMESHPVTNAEYGDFAKSLGEDRYVLLEHNWETKETKLTRTGKTIQAALGVPNDVPVYIPSELNFDKGDPMIFGASVLVKVVDNPSDQYGKAVEDPSTHKLRWEKVFSGPEQPVVGLTYFHMKFYCEWKSEKSGGKYKYDLPTDRQYKYVASNGGRCEYGTEACNSLEKDGRKLAHIGEYNDKHYKGVGRTVSVNDPRYAQNPPFGIQTVGNVLLRTKGDIELKTTGNFMGPYGLYGKAWLDSYWGGNSNTARATSRSYGRPDGRADYVGFSPVVVVQDSQSVATAAQTTMPISPQWWFSRILNRNRVILGGRKDEYPRSELPK